MCSLGWVLIQCVWCPYKKRQFRHRAGRKWYKELQGGDSHPPSKERGLKQIPLSQLSEGTNSQHLVLKLLAPRTVRQQTSVVYATQSWRLEVWNQHASWVWFWRGPASWLADGDLFTVSAWRREPCPIFLLYKVPGSISVGLHLQGFI